jgi:SAM-dependent methyltransferase
MSRESVKTYYEELEDKFERYKGIPALCEPGLHEVIADQVCELVPEGGQVLDVGCGRGAMSLRLHDRGLKVDGCDLFDLCECKDQINFIHASAEDNKITGEYDAILMLELLQATESPFELVRKYAPHLKKGGYMLISSPNIHSDLSRAEYFLRGRHLYFEDHNVKQDGSITPVHEWQMRHIFEDVGITFLRTSGVLEERVPPKGVAWSILKLYAAYAKTQGIEPDNSKISVYVGQRR